MRAGSFPVASLLFVLGSCDAFGADVPSAADQEAAGRTYDEGVAAADRGDFGAAARAFAAADATAPNPTALQAALQAAVRAEDAALGMELVERAEGRPDAASLPIVVTARSQFAALAGRVIVKCDPPCSLSVDGLPSPRTTRWLTVGAHAFRVGGQPPQERTLEVAAGSIEIDLRVPVKEPVERTKAISPPVDPGAADGSDGGSGFIHSPVVFFAGAGVTAVLGGLAIWSLADTVAVQSDFDTKSADYDRSRGDYAELEGLASDGESASIRSWVLLGATAATAVGTTLIGVVVTDWNGDGGTEVGIGPLGGSVRARF